MPNETKQSFSVYALSPTLVTARENPVSGTLIANYAIAKKCMLQHLPLSFKKAGERVKKKSVHKPLFHCNINFIYISTFKINNAKMQNKIKKKC